MNAKSIAIIIAFTVIFIFNVISRIFFNDFQDGWNAYEKKDYKTARELWLPLAEKGHIRAQFFLGFMNDKGFGVPEDDIKAIKWYQLAAEQGDSRAQLFIAFLYDFGTGVQQDYKKAVKWYQLAGKQGHAEAKLKIYELAKKNSPEALKILTMYAENGEANFQYKLGEMYEFGKGVPNNLVLALMWYNLSSLQGHEKATDQISLVIKKLSPKQRQQAEDMLSRRNPRK